MIHCIGNSHVNLFCGGLQDFFQNTVNKLPGFSTYPIGPVIAYNFETSHMPLVLDICKNIPKGAKISLIVGEVDCRWHLPLQANKQQRHIRAVVAECVERFFRSYLILDNEGYKPLVWGTHPTTNGPHNDNLDCPVWGEVEYRNRACQYWNAMLRHQANQYGFPFYSIYDQLVDEKNRTKEEFYQDYCHLNNKAVPLMLAELKDELK